MAIAYLRKGTDIIIDNTRFTLVRKINALDWQMENRLTGEFGQPDHPEGSPLGALSRIRQFKDQRITSDACAAPGGVFS